MSPDVSSLALEILIRRVRSPFVMLAGSVALALVALAPAPLIAQSASPVGVAELAKRTHERKPVRSWQVPTERQSTLAERFVGGFVVGSLAALGAAQLEPDERSWIAGYALASAGGVLLATAARERPRVLPVLLGAAVGSLPLWPLTDPDAEVMHPLYAIGFVSTPLLASFGQNW